jgi:hypothetical protein
MTRSNWLADPKRIAFQAARYKFVGKMLAGRHHVLELGCSDGWGARIVRQHVQALDATDADPVAIFEARNAQMDTLPIRFTVLDILKDVPPRGYDAVYALDLLEHIAPEREAEFLLNVRLTAPIAIFGLPSLESQRYASDISRAGHVNCKSGEDLRATLERVWPNVFMFGMNDEVLHTGHFGMCHYLLALCVA